jgi:hypothetical protein
MVLIPLATPAASQTRDARTGKFREWFIWHLASGIPPYQRMAMRARAYYPTQIVTDLYNVRYLCMQPLSSPQQLDPGGLRLCSQSWGIPRFPLAAIRHFCYPPTTVHRGGGRSTCLDSGHCGRGAAARLFFPRQAACRVSQMVLTAIRPSRVADERCPSLMNREDALNH